jgi:hypothetical protein
MSRSHVRPTTTSDEVSCRGAAARSGGRVCERASRANAFEELASTSTLIKRVSTDIRISRSADTKAPDPRTAEFPVGGQLISRRAVK